MIAINTQADLKAAIVQLENQQKQDKALLKLEFQKAYVSLKPITLIKNSLKEVVQSRELKDELINSGIGLATGYVSKKLFENATHSRFRKILGTALMFGITKIISKNPEAIKSMASGFFNSVKGSNNNNKEI